MHKTKAGGPFYPVFTGRRDSTRPYFEEAMAEMPRPSDNINRTLYLFAAKGFDERDMVSLLGMLISNYFLPPLILRKISSAITFWLLALCDPAL